MTLRTLVILWGLSASFAVAREIKVDIRADETAIRQLIQSGKRLPRIENYVFWSGAYKRPFVGKEKPEPYPENAGEKRVHERTTTNIKRLEISASGDMAWEFSIGNLEYDVEGKAAGHQKFDTGLLRVWKKENGQWKVAAAFIRPLDAPFGNP